MTDPDHDPDAHRRAVFALLILLSMYAAALMLCGIEAGFRRW